MTNMDIGFIILCPERNLGGMKSTFGSIQNYSHNRETICVVGDNVSAAELKEFKSICPTHKGEDTITNLINVGMKKLKNDWAFLLFAGSRIPPYLEHKLAMLTKKEQDVLFPVVNRCHDFISGSFNGVLVNRKFFHEVGEFEEIKMKKPDLNDFELAKFFWAVDAMSKEVCFKAVVGMKVI